MKLKRIIAIMLCIIILLMSLAGCGKDIPPIEDDPDNDLTTPPPDTIVEGIDYDAALTTFPHDTIMMRSGNTTMTWAELYVVIYRLFKGFSDSYGSGIPWDIEVEGQTIAEVLLEYVVIEAKSFLKYRYGLEAIGFTLSEQELADFKEEIREFIEEAGGREDIEETLREGSGYYNLDVFESFRFVEYCIGIFTDRVYGEQGSSFPDEGVTKYVADSDIEIMMAMQILRLKSDDEDDNTPRKEAEDILSSLNASIGADNFTEIFKAQMLEHSEDRDVITRFPDGFLFTNESMVPEFSEAAAALEIGEMSGIVETDYGYYIILRIPLDYDAHLLTTDGSSSGTLRQIAASDDFDSTLAGWFDSLSKSLEFTPEFDTIDLAEIFKEH